MRAGELRPGMFNSVFRSTNSPILIPHFSAFRDFIGAIESRSSTETELAIAVPVHLEIRLKRNGIIAHRSLPNKHLIRERLGCHRWAVS